MGNDWGYLGTSEDACKKRACRIPCFGKGTPNSYETRERLSANFATPPSFWQPDRQADQPRLCQKKGAWWLLARLLCCILWFVTRGALSIVTWSQPMTCGSEVVCAATVESCLRHKDSWNPPHCVMGRMVICVMVSPFRLFRLQPCCFCMAMTCPSPMAIGLEHSIFEICGHETNSSSVFFLQAGHLHCSLLDFQQCSKIRIFTKIAVAN